MNWPAIISALLWTSTVFGVGLAANYWWNRYVDDETEESQRWQ